MSFGSPILRFYVVYIYSKKIGRKWRGEKKKGIYLYIYLCF